MKSTILYILILILLATRLVSCRPEPIPIQLPPEEGTLVIASQIIPNTTMIVAVSRTFNALINTDTTPGNSLLDKILVARALVTVSYNGKTDTLLRVAPGFYGTFTTPLMDNVVYTLHVYDSTTGKRASAETRMMPRVFIDSAIVETSIEVLDTSRILNLSFTDGPEENYYMVNAYRNNDFYTNIISDPASIFRNQQSASSTYALSDKLFQGKSHTEKIDLSGWFQKNDTLTVTLSAISGDYYKYLIEKQRAQRNGLGAFFGEPVNYTTNVKEGYGFFTAHWPSFAQWIIKE
jgi:hypothetical protein